MKTIPNSPTLRAWLRRHDHTRHFAGADWPEFQFRDDLFAQAFHQVAGNYANMAAPQVDIRTAFVLLCEGHPGKEPAAKDRGKALLSRRAVWEIAVAAIIILLLLILATKGHAQGIVLQGQNQGTPLATRGGGLFVLNCSTNMSCSFSGSTFTLTATGGAGTGCVPPGTLGLILFDLTGGACGGATKWSTNGTTTLTGAATAILDLSAAATFKPPQVTAPTVEGTSAFNTTTHLPVWGFNGASTTTIAKTLANVSHKWLNSYDQTTGTLTQTQPDFSDLSGTATTAQLPGTGSTTVNTNTCTLGSSCTIGLGQIGNPAATTSFSYAANQGATVAMTGTATNSWTTDSATAQFFNAKNTTAAVVGTSQGSPKLALCGRAFHGSADVEDCMTFGALPGNGNDAAITFNYGHSGTSTGAVTHVFTGTLQSSALTASLPTCTDANKNITSTCTGLVTVADLASGATTVNGQTCTLGSSCTIPLSAVNAQTATYQVLAADFSNYKTITVASGTFTITLVASGSQPAAGQYIQIINYGSGVVTVARSGQNINGAAGNFTLSAGSATAPTSALVISDATNYFASIDEGTIGTVTSAIVAGTANQVTVTGTCTITTTGTCTLSLPSAVILGTDGSVAGTLQLANGGASAHTIYASGATTTNTIAGFAAVPTTGDLVDCTSASTTCTLHDSGVATANVVTASANGTTKQICTVAASNKACTWIDFPDVKYIPAANCNNTTAGSGWGIGSGGTVTCRAGTNNLGGYISITDTSSTFATFQIEIPEDWDTASNPYIRFQIASTDATNSHTIIPEINVACYKGDGSTTDDVAANGFHSLSTTTLNGSANRFWSGSNVQMNSTDVTGCVAGALMQVTVGRATDTATNAQFYGATVTFPRLLTVQGN